MKSSKIVSRYIDNILQREDVVQRVVSEGSELWEKPLVYHSLAWMTATRAVLALHDESFNALFSAARATIANRCRHLAPRLIIEHAKSIVRDVEARKPFFERLGMSYCNLMLRWGHH